MLSSIFVFIVGACIGSFLNVCIYRIPRQLSIIKPNSFCPNCNASIRWYDNIPIVSYILLKGRCRRCSCPISLRYPLVEILSGFILLILYFKFGITFEFIKFSSFFFLLIVVSFIDIDYHALPISLCFLGMFLGLGFSLIQSLFLLKEGKVGNLDSLPIFSALKGAIFGLGFMYFFKFFGDIFINFYLTLKKKESIEGEKESLGLGDVDFMGVVGAFLGTKFVILTFFIAPFFALFYAVFALIFKRSHVLPYLPYLSLASFFSFLWGNEVLRFLGVI